MFGCGHYKDKKAFLFLFGIGMEVAFGKARKNQTKKKREEYKFLFKFTLLIKKKRDEDGGGDQKGREMTLREGLLLSLKFLARKETTSHGSPNLDRPLLFCSNLRIEGQLTLANTPSPVDFPEEFAIRIDQRLASQVHQMVGRVNGRFSTVGCVPVQHIFVKVGWFLHTPFPSSNVYRMLPSRSILLESVLYADLVGFHTFDHARNFASAHSYPWAGRRIDGVEYQGKMTRVTAFPIGIDPEWFTKALELQQVHEYIKKFEQRFAGRKVILGADHLDTIKGIPQKMLAFEKFLELNQDWRGKVVLVQIDVPSRKDVLEIKTNILINYVHYMLSQGAAIDRILAETVHHSDVKAPIDYVMCVGHFLPKDEDI